MAGRRRLPRTELKHAVIHSIACGGRTSAWTETVLQLLDGEGRGHMPVGTFLGILARSLSRIDGLGDGPLLVEFAHRNAGMQLFQPAAPHTRIADTASRPSASRSPS